MIRHLLQLIWNQRKQNAWLWAELLLVSVFLWFLVDYLYVMGRTYTAPLGFDIRHTYSIVISSLSERSPDYIPKEKRERPDGVHLLTALDRIRTYPGVESACLTDGGMPYYMGSRNLVWRIDTLQVPCRYAFVTPEFFDVFRIYDKDGKTASLKRAIEDNNSIVISADVETMNPGLSLLGQKAYRGNVTDEIEETIRGINVPIRRHEYTKAEPNVYRALRLSRMEEGYYEGMIDAVRLCVRVRPDVDNADFPARFRKDMAEQLRLGNLYLLDVQPLSYIRDGYIRSIGVENEVKTRVAVACFLLANIFLGIIGTFWFRTEYRKGEMGLRMALGSTRRQLNSIMVGEGVLLLVLVFIPSLVISFNIAHMDLIDTYQLPFTWLRFAICGGITFVLIVLMIICGVWYPARSTARLEPAEALHSGVSDNEPDVRYRTLFYDMAVDIQLLTSLAQHLLIDR